MSDDNVVSIKEFYNQDSRITIVENALIKIDKKFDSIDKNFVILNQNMMRLEDKIDLRFNTVDNDFKEIKRDMKSDVKWILTIISALGAIMAHGFHWF